MKTPVIILREALQHALDELHRVNASHACVRPDVTYAAMEALRNTYLAPIENASDNSYPFRCIVWECRWGEWRVAEIFEWSTFAGADLAGLETCAEPYPDGVTAMHYYVGEIA